MFYTRVSQRVGHGPLTAYIRGYFCYKRTKTTLCDDLACSRAIRDLLTRAVSIVFMGYNIKTPYYRAAQAKYKRR